MDSDFPLIMTSPSDSGTVHPGYHPKPRSRAVAQAHNSSTASRGLIFPAPHVSPHWEGTHGSNSGRESRFNFQLSAPSGTGASGRDTQSAQEKRKRSESHLGNSGANCIAPEKDRPTKRPQRPEKARVAFANPSRASDIIVLDDEDKEARREHTPEDIGYGGDGGSHDNAYWGQFVQGGEDLQSHANPAPRRRPGASDSRTAFSLSQIGSPRYGGGAHMGVRPGSHGGLKRRLEIERAPRNSQGPQEISNPPVSLSPGLLDAPSQDNSGHSLLSALSSLTTEKQLLDQKLSETMLDLKAKCFLVEATEAKISDLEDKNKHYKEVTSGLKSRIKGFQKFVDGLGKDYDTLREKNTQLSRKLDELAIDREGLRSSMGDARVMIEMVGGRLEVFSTATAELKEMQLAIGKMAETNEFLQKELSENAGLLASERDRTQSLECQVQSDKKFYQEQLLQNAATLAAEKDRVKVLEKQIQETALKDINIIKAVEDSKVELTEKVIIGLTAKFKGIQDAITAGVQNMKLALETSGDRNGDLIRQLALEVGRVDVPSLLKQVERTVESASDNILGLLHSTQQPTPDTATFGREFIAHLTSQIQGFEKNLEEMHRRRECDLVERLQMEEQITTLTGELSELQHEVLCRRKTESLLKEEAAVLSEKIAAFEAQPQEEPSLVVVIEKMRLEISESKEELERVMKNSRDVVLAKDKEIEALNSRFRDLSLLYSEASKRIEGFEEEKQEYVSHLREEKLKERIELENIANSLRLSEASDLRNRIKALEVQKDRLEAANKLHTAKDRAASSSQDQSVATATGLSTRFEELQAKYMAAERVHSEILRQKDSLEKKVLQLTLERSMQKADARKENESAIEKIESLALESKQAKQTAEAYAAELATLNQQLSSTQTENTRLKLEIEDAKATAVSSLATIAMGKERHEELTKAAKSGETSLMKLILVVVLLRQESKRLSTEVQKLSRENEAFLKRNDGCSAAFPKGIEGTQEATQDTVSQEKEGQEQQQMFLLPQEPNLPLNNASISSETLIDDGDLAPETGMVSFASIDNALEYERLWFRSQELVSVQGLAREFCNMAPGNGDQDAARQDSYMASSKKPNDLETHQDVKGVDKGSPAEAGKLLWQPPRKGPVKRKKRAAEGDCSSQDEEADAEMSPSLPQINSSTLTSVARGGTKAAKNTRAKRERHGLSPDNGLSSPKMAAQDRGAQTVVTPKKTGRHLETLTQAPSRPRTKAPRYRVKKVKEEYESLIDEEKQARRDGGGQLTHGNNDLRIVPKKGAKRL